MATEVLKRLLTRDEYHKMAEAGILSPNDRVELIRGEIYEMSPIGSKHAGIVNRLARLFNQKLESQCIIGVQSPVCLGEINEPEPDISILKYQSDDYISALPTAKDSLIIIEIADSSLSHDREVKKSLYAQFEIPEYWIVDISLEMVEVFTNPSKNDYKKAEKFKKGDSIKVLDQEFDVATFFPS